MLFFLFCLCLFSLIEAIVTAHQKCWNTSDIDQVKDGFISCPETVIIVKDLEVYRTYGKTKRQCVKISSKINEILNCSGLRNICSTKDVDFLALIEENIDHCRSSGTDVLTVCIIFDCIPGPTMNLINRIASNDLKRVQGSYFHAAQFSGMLRCSLYGSISHITFFKLESTDILARNQNGSRILESRNENSYVSYRNTNVSGLFTISKKVGQVEAVELTIYSGNLRNITLNIEGAILYQCRSSTYVNKTNDQKRTSMSNFNEDKCGWFSRELLPWTSTLLSSVLSLILIVIYVIKCLSWKKLKEKHSKTRSSVELTSNHQVCSKVRTNVTDNNYETPHHYTEIQV